MFLHPNLRKRAYLPIADVEPVQRCGKCKSTVPSSQYPLSQRGRNGYPCVDCRPRYSRAKHPPRTCVHCETSYIPKQSNAQYCSRTCKDKAKNQRWKADLEASKPTDRSCVHCSKILPASMRADAIFCSRSCNEKAHALQRKLRARVGGEKPGYLRAAVCERDSWTCQLCSTAVDPDLLYPHPAAPSLDHIIPVSLGGGNEPENLRLTHLRCNLARGNRVA